MQDNSGRQIRRELKGGQLGEKVGEKTGEEVKESLGEIHKLNLCLRSHQHVSCNLQDPIIFLHICVLIETRRGRPR